MSFGVRGLAIGYASWFGRSYSAGAPRRALKVEDLVACELTVQMLQCYTRHLQMEAQAGVKLRVPEQHGWRFLRAAHSRLTTPRQGETLQHRLLRDAVLRVTGLSERLKATQELLRR